MQALAAQPTHEYWADAPEPPQLATLDRRLVSFALSTGLAANAELVSAPSTVQQPSTRYSVKRV